MRLLLRGTAILIYLAGAACSEAIPGVSVLSSSNPTVVADPANSFITISTSSVVVSSGSNQAVLIVSLRGSGNEPVIGVTPTISDYGLINEISPSCTATDTNGDSICTFSSSLASAREIDIATPVVVTAATDTVTFVADAPAAAVFTSNPGTTMSGVAFTVQPTVELRDAFGNLVDNYSGAVTLDTSSTAGLLVGTTTVSAVAGVATFSGLKIEDGGTGYKLFVSSPAVTGESSAFSIGPDRVQILGSIGDLSAFTCAAVSVYTRDALGVNAAVLADTQINFSTNHPALLFYSDSGCTTSITNLNLMAGSFSDIVYIKATDSGGAYNISGSDNAGALTTIARSDLKVRPFVDSVSAFSCPAPAAKVGDMFMVQAVFSESVTAISGGGTLEFNLETGPTDSIATFNLGSSGGTVVRFNYTVAAGHTTPDLDYTSASAMTVAGGASIVSNSTGLSADIILPTPGTSLSLSGTSNCPVDGIAPTITSISAPSAGLYGVSQTLSFDVTFSESITDTGTPRIPITINGPTVVYASYASQPSATSLRFSYTVANGHNDYDGIAVASSVDLNGGTIKDSAGNNSSLTFAPPNLSGSFKTAGVWLNTAGVCAPPYTDYNMVGSGTLALPYVICNKTQLNNLGANCGPIATACAYSYELQSNIDLASLTSNSFNIIGSLANPFTGSLDGNNFKIGNLTYIDAAKDYIGLIGYSSGADIQDLKLENFYLSGNEYVGALIGKGTGSTSNLSNIQILGGNILSDVGRVGGMIGMSEQLTITRAMSSADIYSSATDIGGLIGLSLMGSLSEVFATGTVVGSGNTGGLLGRIYWSTLSDCYARGNVQGWLEGGGLTGAAVFNGSSSYITKCYAANTPNVSAFAGFLANGAAAVDASSINNNYFDSTLAGPLPAYTFSVTPTVAPSISAQTTASMQTQATFTGWDFTTIWEMPVAGYPLLRNVPVPPPTFARLRRSFNSLSGVMYSIDDFIFTNTSNALRAVQGSVGKSSGKWYYEVTTGTLASGGAQAYIGLGRATSSNANYVGSEAGANQSWGCPADASVCMAGGTSTGLSLASFSTSGKIIGVAVDLDNDMVWYRINGGPWQNSGSPGTLANPIFSGVTGTVYPMANTRYNSSELTFNFGKTGFSATPPVGYLGWSQ